MIHSKDNLLKLIEFLVDEEVTFNVSPFWLVDDGWKVEAKVIHNIEKVAEWCKVNDTAFHFYNDTFSFSDPVPVREPPLFYRTEDTDWTPAFRPLTQEVFGASVAE